MAKKDQYVVDSSVVAKWFLMEPGSGKAIELRDRFAIGRLKLVVPTLMFYEVMNALRFSGGFDQSELVVAARSLSRYRFDIWRPRGKLLELSTSLALEKGLTVYDAFYVALAQRTGSRVVTEDGELLSKFPSDTAKLSELEAEP